MHFEVIFRIITSGDIFTKLSGSDSDMMNQFKDYFRECLEFHIKDPKNGYKKYFNNLNSRTDISQDDKWEIECYEENIAAMCNLYDILKDYEIKKICKGK